MTTDWLQSSAKLTVPLSFNRYSYAVSDPVNSIDPFGLASFCVYDPGTKAFTCRFSFVDSAGATYSGQSTDNQLSEALLFAEAGAYLGKSTAVAVDALTRYPLCAGIFSTAEKRGTPLWNPVAFIRKQYSGQPYAIIRFNTFVSHRSYFSTTLTTDGETAGFVLKFFNITFGNVDIKLSRRFFIDQGRNGNFGALAHLLIHELGHLYDFLAPVGSGGSLIVDDDLVTEQLENIDLVERRCRLPLL